MGKQSAIEFLNNHGCLVGELADSGETFVLIEDRYALDAVLTDSQFDSVVSFVTGGSWNSGYSDEYTTCSNCGRIIRTSPDSYTWKPRYWLTDGEIFCEHCIDAFDYLDYHSTHDHETRSINSDLVDPEAYGFTKLLSNLENGLHEHMSDNPTAIAEWSKQHNLRVIFDVEPSQFYVTFNVYVSRLDEELYEFTSLSDSEIEVLREELITDSSYGSDYLKPEYRDTRKE